MSTIVKKRTVTGHRIAIDKEALMKAPELERVFFILLGHFGNEIIILNKLMFAISNQPQGTQPEESAFTSQALFGGKLLMSKLFEGWEKLFQKMYLSTILGRDYGPLLSSGAQESLAKLKQFFGQNSYPAEIRNKLGFHYPDQLILEALPTVADTEDWAIYLTKSSGNSLYFAADMVAGHALLNLIDPNDRVKAMKRMWQDCNFLVEHFIPVINECMFVFVQRHMKNVALGEPNFSVVAVPIQSVTLPYFVDPSAFVPEDV